MLKIAVVTSTRAEYGILRPLLFKLHEDQGINLKLLVTGTHLLEKYGNTQKEIEKDGIPIEARFSILKEGNTPYDISIAMANAIRKFAEYFRDERPDFVVILGDRTEMLGVCCAAMNEGVRIIHLHGGELTEGAVDDCVRHAITKMSFLHFPATDVYRRRIIQLGEQPDRVFNVGALGVENILNVPLLEYDVMCEDIGIPKGRKYAVVTFHPVTLENGQELTQVSNLIEAMNQKKEYFYLITKANADTGGDIVNKMFEEYAEKSKNVKLVASLGMVRYLSAVKYSEFVLGNSSSGIIEAPSLGTPTVNVGNRQKGRLMAKTVINCKPDTRSILEAIDKVKTTPRNISLLYGDGNTSDKIVAIIKQVGSQARTNREKNFFDIRYSRNLRIKAEDL